MREDTAVSAALQCLRCRVHVVRLWVDTVSFAAYPPLALGGDVSKRHEHILVSVYGVRKFI